MSSKKLAKHAVAPADRAAALNRQRNLKMARSAHAYVRGNTEQFYEWLESSRGRTIPLGPPVWICGDCHVGNLGPIANAKGNIEIQIRDLDQTVIGNPAHDLVRLGLSLASAGRGSDLPGITTAQMIEQMIVGYELAFAERTDGAAPEIEEPTAVRLAMKRAIRRKWRHLARERLGENDPRIPLGRRFWPLLPEERKTIAALFAEEKVRRLVTSLRKRDDDAPVQVLDAAYWVKGCSSLGLGRYSVLVAIGAEDELCLMDVKEATSTVAPRAPGCVMPKDSAERVAAGAWHLSPALGERMLAGRLGSASVFLRELLPQDLKFEIEILPLEEATNVAKYLATVVGKAHARQMDEAQRKKWLKELRQNRTKTLDAPSWLWSSVVDLVVEHERGYLEHCRRHAGSAAAR